MMDTSEVYNIVRFRYQCMDVTILYLYGQLIKSFYIYKCV